MSKVARTRFLLVLAGMGGLLYGIDFGAIAAAMPYIRELKMFTGVELSGVAGAVLPGGIVSSSVLFLIAIPLDLRKGEVKMLNY